MTGFLKRTLPLLLALTILVSAMAPAALAVDHLSMVNSKSIVNTTWYGEYLGHYHDTNRQYKAAATLTIHSCDQNGSFSATQIHIDKDTARRWEIEETGTINFSTGAFRMADRRVVKGSNWYLDQYEGKIDNDGITGTVGHTNGRVDDFYWARTSSWALDEITEANLAGLIPDTLRGKDLTQRITRGEFAAVSVTLYEKLAKATLSPYTGTVFQDISGNINESNIRKAYAANIAVGMGNGIFAPDVTLNREQLATMLTRVVKKYAYPEWSYATDDQYYLDTSGVKKYADDGNISDWAKPSVYYLTKMSVLNGVGDGLFAPKAVTGKQEAEGYATATREQAIVIAARIFKLADILK